MQPRLALIGFFYFIFAELVGVESLSTVLDLRVKLESALRLVDEFVLQLQVVNEIRYFSLLYHITLTKVCKVDTLRHLKLLNLVDPLVNLASLIHEVFELKDANRLVLLDSLAHKRQHIVFLSEASLLLQHGKHLKELHLIDLVEDRLHDAPVGAGLFSTTK